MSTAVHPAALFAADPADAAPETEIVRDLTRRALPIAPVAVAVAALFAGVDGARSATVGVALVLVNFIAAATSLAWAARINYGVLMGTALFGYLVRMTALFGVVFVLRDLAWVHLPSLGVTIVVTHLGFLAWELRFVSASLAHPALKPEPQTPDSRQIEARSPQQ